MDELRSHFQCRVSLDCRLQTSVKGSADSKGLHVEKEGESHQWFRFEYAQAEGTLTTSIRLRPRLLLDGHHRRIASLRAEAPAWLPRRAHWNLVLSRSELIPSHRWRSHCRAVVADSVVHLLTRAVGTRRARSGSRWREGVLSDDLEVKETDK